MAKRVGAAEAKAHFSELTARVAHGGERFLLQRRGTPVAALVSVEDLRRLESECERASSRALGALALVGAWGDLVEDEEVDALLAEIYAERERDRGRPVDLDA